MYNLIYICVLFEFSILVFLLLFFCRTKNVHSFAIIKTNRTLISGSFKWENEKIEFERYAAYCQKNINSFISCPA